MVDVESPPRAEPLGPSGVPVEVVNRDVQAAADWVEGGDGENVADRATPGDRVQDPRQRCGDRVFGAQRQVADHHRDRQRAAPEHGRGERCEAIEVRTDDDDVVGSQRRVGDEQVAEGVAQHLQLADRAMAGVDLDAGVR